MLFSDQHRETLSKQKTSNALEKGIRDDSNIHAH